MKSISDTQEYREVCLMASLNDENFANFKQNPYYTFILEHVSEKQGQLYLDYLYENSKDLLDRIEEFKCNDIYGDPKKFFYQGIGEISPTTLRYIKVLSDIRQKVGDLKGRKVVEIGCGYGGQCLILKKYFHEIDYYIIDLSEALCLTKKYLEKNDLSANVIEMSNLQHITEKFDLVISNYAYSELSRDLQDLYYDSLIRNSKSGYFTFNFISSGWGIDSYSKEEISQKFHSKKIQILEEKPSTHEQNIILFWTEKYHN